MLHLYPHFGSNDSLAEQESLVAFMTFSLQLVQLVGLCICVPHRTWETTHSSGLKKYLKHHLKTGQRISLMALKEKTAATKHVGLQLEQQQDQTASIKTTGIFLQMCRHTCVHTQKMVKSQPPEIN